MSSTSEMFSPNVDSDEANGGITMLEEQHRIKELVLKDLLERKAIFTKKLEDMRRRRQELLDRRRALSERRLQLGKARIKHLMFQKELRESLVKSRERLAKLEALEQMERDSQDDSASCEISAFSDEPLANSVENKMEIVMDLQSEPEIASLLVGEMAENPPTTHALGNLVGNQFLDSRCTFGEPRSFNEKHIHVRSLMNFLPMIDHHAMRTILRFSMLEAKSLDISGMNAQRRKLLLNTCVDFAVLSQQAADTKEVRISSQESSSAESMPNYLDPHLSLCPYELAGVCADAYCPYQHISRETLPREEIPLPPLLLLAPSYNEDKKLEAKKAPVGTGKPTVADETKPTLTRNPDHVDDADKFDFIALPQAESDESMELDSSSTEDGQDDDEGGEQMLTVANTTNEELKPASLSNSFWCGEQINIRDLSVDQIINQLQGNAIDAAPSTSPGARKDGNIAASLFIIVDGVRFALHSGRFDLAEILNNQVGALTGEFNEVLVERLRCITRHSFLYHSIESSFIRTSFEGQTALAILSIYLELGKNSSHVDHSSLEFVARGCTSMWSFGGITDSDEMFTIADFRNILSGPSHDDFSTSRHSEERVKINDLLGSLEWVQRRFGGTNAHLDNIHRIDNHILKPSWAATQRWIGMLNEDELQWGGVKAVILIGNILLGCLECFATQVEGDSLNPSLTATLINVDATVSQILKTLSKQLRFVPLIDALLAPLHAASISTAIFLRQYSSAQHRLDSLLTLPLNHSNENLFLTRFAELLWSQFFHARMALRVESPQGTSKPNAEGRTTRSKGYAFELSLEAEEDNTVLLDMVEKLGIRLHHVTLEGDRVLAHALSNSNFPSEKQLSCVKATKLTHVASKILQIIFSGEAGTKDKDVDVSNLSCLEVADVDFDALPSRSNLTASPTISSVPRSLLLAGRALQNLSLVKCHLSILPVSFGMHFPNLLVLDLSENKFEQIPLSFGSLSRLERLMLSQNRIRGLSGDEFTASLKYLDLSHNSLMQLSLDLADSIGRRCFQLESLDLSNNYLDKESTKFLTETAVPKWVLQMKGLRQVELLPQKDRILEGV